jgi:hypothetical protein
MLHETFFGLSVMDFWHKFFADDASDCMTKYYEERKETEISIEKWRDPEQDEKVYEKL